MRALLWLNNEHIRWFRVANSSPLLISYVLPVYNESEGIQKFYQELKKTTDAVTKYNYEFVFINDGSRDNSREILSQLHQQDNRIRIIDFARNFGHQMAITAGLDYAHGDAVIIMDTDLQDPPRVSLELVSKWLEGYEVVYAQRLTRRDTFFKRHSASLYYRMLHKLAEIDIPKDTGDFRLIDKKALHQLRRFRERNRYVRGIVASLGFRQTAVQFDRDERTTGETNYPFRKMLKLALDGVTSFSAAPLELIMKLGFWVFVVSLLGILYALIMRIFFPGVTVEGWTLMLVSILFMGGIQIMSLGVIGLYVGRIYRQVQERPLYIINEVIGDPDAEN
jgi:polyisoprenyl-phosphate glycosyltransferase